MIDKSGVVIWMLIPLAVFILAIIEEFGLLDILHFHTLSFLSRRNKVLAGIIWTFFIGLVYFWPIHLSHNILR